VNYLHIITLYKSHNKLSCELRSSWQTCPACRARRVERVELVVSSVSSHAVRQARRSQDAWVRHVESCRDVMSQVEFGLIQTSQSDGKTPTLSPHTHLNSAPNQSGVLKWKIKNWQPYVTHTRKLFSTHKNTFAHSTLTYL